MATQSSGSDGLTEDNEGDGGDGNGGQGQGAGGQGQWGVGVEKGVWDEPIIKRWEDAKVSFIAWKCYLLSVFSAPLYHRSAWQRRVH